MSRYDAVIVGSGPAGVSAALNLKLRGKSFLLFGSADLSHKIAKAPKIENYPGLPGITGAELQERLQDHLRVMDIQVTSEQVTTILPIGDYFSIATAHNMYEASCVILAPGVFTAKMLPGEQEFLGRGVSYCATCDAPLYKGKKVVILGYSGEAVAEAAYMTQVAGKVWYVPLVPDARRPVPGAETLNAAVAGIEGDKKAGALLLEDRKLEVDGVFILRDMIAPDSLLPGLPIQDGFIRVDVDMNTGIPGCFAAGDCTGKPHQYMRAAGQGQTAALNAVAWLDRSR